MQWRSEDATRGLSFPDGYFDVIHARLLVAGVRNWKALVTEVSRLLKPGGLVTFVEADALIRMEGVSMEDAKVIAPGFTKFADYLCMCVTMHYRYSASAHHLERAMENRGYDVTAGMTTIPKLLNADETLGGVVQVHSYLPLWAWSDGKWKSAAAC